MKDPKEIKRAERLAFPRRQIRLDLAAPQFAMLRFIATQGYEPVAPATIVNAALGAYFARFPELYEHYLTWLQTRENLRGRVDDSLWQEAIEPVLRDVL